MTKAMKSHTLRPLLRQHRGGGGEKAGGFEETGSHADLFEKAGYKVYHDGREVPGAPVFSHREADGGGRKEKQVILFFHGGGWITESVENYNRVCARMAQSTGILVASVEVPAGAGARVPHGTWGLLRGGESPVWRKASAGSGSGTDHSYGGQRGGNLAAAVSLLARERGRRF